MSLDSGLSPTTITEVSLDKVTALPNIQLVPVPLSNLVEAEEDVSGVRANPPAPVLAGDHDGDGTSHPTPIAYIDGVPVTVSVQNVDGQQRIVCVALNPSGAAVSFMDQLTESNPDGPPQPLSLAEEWSILHPGMELLLTDPLDPVSQPQADPPSLGQDHPPPCLLLEVQQRPLEPQTHEPKKEKRKGGWPKGKKRKPKKELTAPKAPTTGYVIFVNERRLQLRQEHPDLPFTEITRMLGLHWSQLDSLHKQRYNHEAEKDKQRYITELMAYQNTEAYQAFLRKKALGRATGFNGDQGADMETDALALNPNYGEESSDLFCGICNQCFSSLHNKKEHLLGKQHLQTLTEEFEKDKGSLPNTSSLGRELEEEIEKDTEREGGEEEEDEELAGLLGLSSLDISVLQELLIRHMNMRDFELQHVDECVARERRRQEQLKAELEDLQERKVCLEAELEALRASGESLDSHIQTLSMEQLLSPAERDDDHRHEQAPPIAALHH
ncbi:SWI/SNF-related matrix-associated actin-dependent regulator of chromatin subfamily E member 1-related-like isoform X2 [Osmerus eperlanus]|uniref:SWI/SNF-related matrix-associated actin-dependent regulator of chromatin subfamily E member 1-related-like isoform X2 n=1 Tax=Osmerus eperlanus TaxID=29151 RepID=UPI002E11FA40